jgi:hypothetical protein
MANEYADVMIAPPWRGKQGARAHMTRRKSLRHKGIAGRLPAHQQIVELQ